MRYMSMSVQRWSMSPSHTALSGKFMKGRLRHSKSDVDIRLASSNSPASSKAINVRKDTLKFDVNIGSMRVPLQKEYNIVLLGQAAVGKSAILVRFSTGRFIHEYHPTLEMTYEMLADIDEDTTLLRIFDTANTTEPVHLTEGRGFLVIYSIDNRLSFETAKQLVKLTKEFKRLRRLSPSIVLVGNKLDLEHLRVVSKREGRIFAMRNDCSFFETSAMDDVNICSTFHEVVRQLRGGSKNRSTLSRKQSFTKLFSR
ncbi:ras-related protein Rap-2a-like [Xenia sp. Carnegie-2017]|uniref:ras-related protein Rap-2a-like n=1 Tax=Xenia sp. Carnegie-2017 TaxID=2897299 RepID=UPI001F03BFBD|nr:ras-related protein Rap-2a-like [Xenia sp. Carnegie-2017]